MSFCQWLQQTPLIAAITNSPFLSTVVEVVHYFSLFLLVGSICILDLRLLGLASRQRNAAELANEMLPVLWTGLTLNFLSGFLLFAGDATTLVDNWVFQIKLAVILLAVVFGAIVLRGVRKWGNLPGVPLRARLLAFVWFIERHHSSVAILSFVP